MEEGISREARELVAEVVRDLAALAEKGETFDPRIERRDPRRQARIPIKRTKVYRAKPIAWLIARILGVRMPIRIEVWTGEFDGERIVRIREI